MLLTCISVVGDQQFCAAFYIQMPFECKFCNLEAPSVVEAFQPISVECACPSEANGYFEFYGKFPYLEFFILGKIVQTSLGSKSLGISDQPLFSAIVPQVGNSVIPCIRSLPASSIFVNKCFEKIEVGTIFL